MDSETRQLLDDIHEEVRKHSVEEGEAVRFGPPLNEESSVAYWDAETEQWLWAAHVDGRWHKYPMDSFPKGMELSISWDEHEYVPVEETPLHHETYGLDEARGSNA